MSLLFFLFLLFYSFLFISFSYYFCFSNFFIKLIRRILFSKKFLHLYIQLTDRVIDFNWQYFYHWLELKVEIILI